MGKKLIIDLFSGCGGFSLGFHKEGFDSFLSSDFDESSCRTFSNAFRDSIVLNEDITKKKFKNLLKLKIQNHKIKGVIAGLPCQSFSSVGRAQDKHSMKFDKRNYFYKDFFECIKIIKPDFFVFENVSGIMSAKPKGKNIFDDIIRMATQLNYLIIDDKKQMLLNSVEYGVPQVRKRVFVIGVNKKLKIHPSKIYEQINKLREKRIYSVKDAIYDLPKLYSGEGSEVVNFNSKKGNTYLKKLRKKNQKRLYNHVARSHNSSDKERYSLLAKMKGELIDLQKVRPDLIHHNPKHFKNRYTVQKYDLPGRTVVSHLHKDGNLFIHPDPNQERTFTVREAARIQSFPDSFRFLGSRTNQFKQVGNAVPPLLAQKIAKAVNRVLYKI